MISNIDIKRQYIDLYKNLRKYMWDYKFVCCLVDLEDSVLKKFPNMSDVRKNVNKLYSMCKTSRSCDEDLQRAFIDMKNLVEDNECGFAFISVNVKE